jgi:hypothetical protein
LLGEQPSRAWTFTPVRTIPRAFRRPAQPQPLTLYFRNGYCLERAHGRPKFEPGAAARVPKPRRKARRLGRRYLDRCSLRHGPMQSGRATAIELPGSGTRTRPMVGERGPHPPPGRPRQSHRPWQQVAASTASRRGLKDPADAEIVLERSPLLGRLPAAKRSRPPFPPPLGDLSTNPRRCGNECG